MQYQSALTSKQTALAPLRRNVDQCQSVVNITRAELELLMSSSRKHAQQLSDTRAALENVSAM